MEAEPLRVVPRPEGPHRIGGHRGRRRDLGQGPAVRPPEAERAVGAALDPVALLVNRAVVPATEEREVRERGQAAPGEPPCRPRPGGREAPGSRAAARFPGPRPAGPPTASPARSARHGRPCQPVPPPAAALRSPAWPRGSGPGPWHTTAPRGRGPGPSPAASPGRAPPGPSHGPPPGRAPPASSARRRRSGTRCSSPPGRRTRGSDRGGARWRPRDARTARRSRRPAGPAPRRAPGLRERLASGSPLS